MAKRHEIEISGKKVVVYEHEDVCDPTSGRAYTGSWVWDCSYVLAYWMACSSSISFTGKRVVELGAGTGIPGLVAASIGAYEVVLTDIHPLLPGLHTNVEVNGLCDTVKVMPLLWGDDSCCKGISYPPVDFVLMSDLLYDVTAMPALCHTLRQLISRESNNNDTQILMSCELRFGTWECLEVMMEQGFVLSQVPNCQLHPDWQGQGYAVYIATLGDGRNI